MPYSTQQQAKSMSQQWGDSQSNNTAQPQSNDFTQDFITNSGANTYAQQKSDYYQQYNRQLNDMNYGGQQANSRKQNQDEINTQNSQNANATLLQQHQSDMAQQQNQLTRGASSSQGYGTNAAPPTNYNSNIYTGQHSAKTGDEYADWQDAQGTIANNNSRLSQASASGDVLRTQAQTDGQLALARQQSQSDAAKQGVQDSYQGQQNALDRTSLEKQALIKGYSSNPLGYKYWG